MTNGIEKRLFPRKPLRIKVTFEDEFGDGIIWLYSDNISLGGIFLASDIPISIGSSVFMSFSLPSDSRCLRASGEIIRVEKEAGCMGMGVRFIGLTPEGREAIQDFVTIC
jgi:uncharacterized protein (TIGR02266 family)